ncbi:MAG: polysaccharide deacetylase family protein [Planctomycetales bacterium]|nr:polysaccharide deacetylase family protein [Planctomycetales bacterium]
MGRQMIANLSLDLDNQWSYMKTHGDEGWQEFPSYLDSVVPYILETLATYQLNITFFVVGRDAELEKNHAALTKIAQAGHEIGNHSFYHEPWLQRYSNEQLEEEFDKAEAAIATFTDQKLIGFRGPGFCLSKEILELLQRRGYQYDGSTFPTFIGPLARAYYFFNASLSSEEQEDRQELFGSIRDGLRRLKPYRWALANGPMLEFPVTTIPLLRSPFHLSYLLFLLQYSEWLAITYFYLALSLCKLTRTPPSLLLHPLDFLGGDEIAELRYFPGMKVAGHKKRQFVSKVLKIYSQWFDVVSMGRHAELLATQKLPTKHWK